MKFGLIANKCYAFDTKYMGLAFGMLLGPIFLAIFVGIFLKLTLDAFSDYFYGHPFKFLGWPTTILLTITLVAGEFYLIYSDSPFISFISLNIWLGIALFGIVTLPVLAFYGLIKRIFLKTKDSEIKSSMSPNFIDESLIKMSIKKKWVYFWLISISAFPIITILDNLIMGNSDYVANSLGAVVPSLLFGLLVYPLVLVCIRIHVYLRLRK